MPELMWSSRCVKNCSRLAQRTSCSTTAIYNRFQQSQFRQHHSSGEHTGHKAGVPQEAMAHRGNANTKYRLQDVCEIIGVAICHHVAPDHNSSKWTSFDSRNSQVSPACSSCGSLMHGKTEKEQFHRSDALQYSDLY